MALKRPNMFPDNPDMEPDRFPDNTGRIRPGDVGVRVPSRQIGRIPHDTPKGDYDAWREFIGQWCVKKPLDINLSVGVNGPIVYVRMSCDQPDAAQDQRLARQISLQVDIPVPTVAPDGSSARWVRALVRWFILHELDEWIEVQGQRIFDPHRGGRTPSPENS